MSSDLHEYREYPKHDPRKFPRSYDTLLKQVSDEYFKEMHQSDFVKHFYDEAVEKRKEEEKKKNDAIEAALKRQQPQRVIKHLSEGYTFEVGNKAALEARPKRDKFKEPEPRQYLAKLPDMPFIDGYTGKGMHEVANRRQKVTKKPPPTYKRHLPLADEDVWRKFSQLSSAKGSQFQWPDRSVLAQTQAQQPPEIPAQLAALSLSGSGDPAPDDALNSSSTSSSSEQLSGEDANNTASSEAVESS